MLRSVAGSNCVASLWALCLSALLLPNAIADDSSSGEITIYRDTWGVPHVYAQTEAAGAYDLGYAQAEDRLGDIC